MFHFYVKLSSLQILLPFILNLLEPRFFGIDSKDNLVVKALKLDLRRWCDRKLERECFVQLITAIGTSRLLSNKGFDGKRVLELHAFGFQDWSWHRKIGSITLSSWINQWTWKIKYIFIYSISECPPQLQYLLVHFLVQFPSCSLAT